MTDPRTHVLLVGHGTVSDLDDLPAFLANIRQGRHVPAELVQHVRHRYEAIGGQSPLTAIAERQAQMLQGRLGIPVHVAMRLWQPYVRDVVASAVEAGARRIVSMPMAPFSVPLYHRTVDEAVALATAARGVELDVVRAPYWNDEPSLIGLFADLVREALERFPAGDRTSVGVVPSAHSLPTRTLREGDPYAALVARTAELVVARACPDNPVAVAFQSQGATPDPWLGPTLDECFRGLVARGVRDVLIAPIGFLTDHVETLYDLDIEARPIAEAAGVRRLERTRLPNDDPRLIDALEAVVRRALAPPS
ncbi:MAG: ferrochelatase [Deltaproteobacteria bacterium]|nr:ferrochelatase [Deltaproteobacteria bacterium]